MRIPNLRFATTVACIVLCSTAHQAKAGSYTFTSIDVPGAGYTAAYGINNSGQIVGTYLLNGAGASGFVDSGGTFTSVNIPPSSPPFLNETYAFGINDHGQVVGELAADLFSFVFTGST